MAYFTMEASAWILAIITIDRYLILVNNKWKQKCSRNIKFNLLIIVLVLFVIFLINLPVAFLNGRVLLFKPFNFTDNLLLASRKKVECYSTKFIKIYQYLALLLECVLPLTLMITFNYLLIKKTYKSTTKLNSASQSNAPLQNLEANEEKCPTSSLFPKYNQNNHNKSHSTVNNASDKTKSVEIRLASSFNDLISLKKSDRIRSKNETKTDKNENFLRVEGKGSDESQ